MFPDAYQVTHEAFIKVDLRDDEAQKKDIHAAVGSDEYNKSDDEDGAANDGGGRVDSSSTTLNQTIRQVPLGMLLKHLQLMHLVPSSTIRPLDLQEQREELPQRLTTAPDTTGQGIWPWLRPPNSCGPTEGREWEDGGGAHVMTDSR